MKEAIMARRALILIDVQNDYFPGGKWTLSGIESAADNAAKLLAAARAAEDLVIHVWHEFTSPEAPFFMPKSQGAQIHPSVRNLEGEAVILKHHVNSFRATDLKEILDSNGIEEASQPTAARNSSSGHDITTRRNIASRNGFRTSGSPNTIGAEGVANVPGGRCGKRRSSGSTIG